LQVGYSQLAKNLIKANTKTVNQKRFEKFKMNTKLATSRMRTGQWADIIKDCKESGLKVDDYCAQHGLSRNAYFYWLRKVKEAALTQSGFVEVQQQVEVSSCYPSPKLTASVNEVVLEIDENTPMDLLANIIKVLKNA